MQPVFFAPLPVPCVGAVDGSGHILLALQKSQEDTRK